MDVPDVVVVTEQPAVRDPVVTAAAALGQRCDAVAASDLAPRWASAGTVFIGQDVAPAVAAHALPPRERVYLLANDPAAAATWSVPLGAELIVLPQGQQWVSSVLARQQKVGGELVTVLGGSGGVGASTLAACVAWRAAGKGRSVALVDIDRWGGGIDLLVGAERSPGWRWPRFAAADGVLGDVTEFVPQADGVTVISTARGEDHEVARQPLSAVLASLQRTHELVVIDAGRPGGVAYGEAVRSSDRGVLVVAGTVRGLAAAGQVIRGSVPPACSAIVRQYPPARVPTAAVQDSLGLPVIGRWRHDPALVAAAERGDRPVFTRRRAGLGRLVDALVGA